LNRPKSTARDDCSPAGIIFGSCCFAVLPRSRQAGDAIDSGPPARAAAVCRKGRALTAALRVMRQAHGRAASSRISGNPPRDSGASAPSPGSGGPDDGSRHGRIRFVRSTARPDPGRSRPSADQAAASRNRPLAVAVQAGPLRAYRYGSFRPCQRCGWADPTGCTTVAV